MSGKGDGHKCVITFSRVAWVVGVIGSIWMVLYLVLSSSIIANANDISVLDNRQYKMYEDISDIRVFTSGTAKEIENLKDDVGDLKDSIKRIEEKLDERNNK